MRCKSENHVPIVAVSDAPRIPDALSKASGDRLQNSGARPSGDRSRAVLQSNVPSQENPDQASGDRSHVPGVEASGEGLSGKPPDSYNVVVEQLAGESEEKHLLL